MRRPMRLASFLLCSLLVSCGPGDTTSSGKTNASRRQRPNIVFILADDLGWADVGYQGSSFHPTPHIDALSKRGMVFSQAYASSPVCSPTRYSFLTGQNPARHRMTKALNSEVIGARPAIATKGPVDKEWWEPTLQDHIPTEQTTIAERLGASGYRTGVIGKWHLGDPLAPEHGFDVAIATAKLGGPSSYFSPYGIQAFADGPEGEYITDRLTDEAVNFIEDSKEGPFFLFLSHFAPHSPWEAKKELIVKNQENVDPQTLQKNPIYAAMIESLDESVGRIVSTLDESGLTNDTLLVFTSDNGALTQRWLRRRSKHRTLFEITSNAPLRGGKGKLYEGGLRVPTIACWPGVIEAGAVCDVPIDTTDYYPSFLELSGSRPQGEILDGVDITPLLRGAKSLDREALYFHFPHQTLVCALRKGNDKLVHFFNGGTELYDLARDPGEENDLSAQNTERTSQLKDELFAWLGDVDALLPVRNPAFQ